MLGCKWMTEADLLSPGLGELNLSKKMRELKKPNITPVVSREDAEKPALIYNVDKENGPS